MTNQGDPYQVQSPVSNDFYSAGGIGAVSGLINVGAGLYDSYQNRKTSKQNTQRTIAANKAEAELAYQRSVEMWNMQNAYNSPEQQMARFGAAGLNPHLIYGQGSPGQAGTPPAYQPPNMQYRYQAPQYGAAIGTLLPTLMAVGTWMQNMRQSEVDIKSKTTGIDRTQQLIDYLREKNPRDLEVLNNRLSLYPYQRDMASAAADQAHTKSISLAQEYRYKYGDGTTSVPAGGTAFLHYLQEASKTKLLDAKASFTNLNITDPQALMQLVLSGVMGLAGQQMRINQRARKVPTAPYKRPVGVNRINPKRRFRYID